jgi:hypothetical protein
MASCREGSGQFTEVGPDEDLLVKNDGTIDSGYMNENNSIKRFVNLTFKRFVAMFVFQ